MNDHTSPPAGSLPVAPRALVVDIDHFAVHDGPGIRTAVFLKGCPLRCIWCHSPETQSFTPELLFLPQKCTACGLCLSACPRGAISPDLSAPAGENCRVAVDVALCDQCGACTAVCYPSALKMSGAWMTAAEALAQVEGDQPFFAASGGGVTLTGGEVTAQPDFARAFLAGCKALGIHTAIETNGCSPWRVFADLLPLVDLFLYDLKHMDDAEHRRLTGVSNHLALSNLHRLAGQGANVIVRVPCIPGLNDSPQNIAATARFAFQARLRTIHLLPYNPSAGAKYQWLGRGYDLPGLEPQPAGTMAKLADICRLHGLNVQIEG